MKLLLDFLSLPLSLPINPLWDLVICAILGEFVTKCLHQSSICTLEPVPYCWLFILYPLPYGVANSVYELES